jgi:ABC-type amino acid transport substrate-binding protein
MQRLLTVCAAVVFTAGIAGAQGGLDVIRQQGYLRICADPSNLPFSGADAATPGFEVELARLIARELGVEARLQWSPTFVRPLQPLRDGACDLFMGLPTDTRFTAGNPWVAISQPYYVMSHAVVAKTDSGITALSDLIGRRVAVEGASVADSYVPDAGMQRGLYNGQEQAFRAVAAGEAPAALLWLPVASWLTRREAALHTIPIVDPHLEFQIGAGVRRRDRDLAVAVDGAVGRLKDSGEAQAIIERYGASAKPRGGPAAHVATPIPMKDRTAEGRSLFSTACSHCHGVEGVGRGTGSGIPALRNYEGGQEKFLRIVEHGKQDTAMAPFKGILTAEEILTIYRYLTSLSRP